MPSSIDFILLDIAPEMADVPQDKRERLIEYAMAQVKFGDDKIRYLATAYLTAHQYTLSQRNGAAGPVSSEKEGDLARSFGSTTGNKSTSSTSYGEEFERLKRMFIIKPMVRNM